MFPHRTISFLKKKTDGLIHLPDEPLDVSFYWWVVIVCFPLFKYDRFRRKQFMLTFKKLHTKGKVSKLVSYDQVTSLLFT